MRAKGVGVKEKLSIMTHYEVGRHCFAELDLIRVYILLRSGESSPPCYNFVSHLIDVKFTLTVLVA